MVRHSLIVVLMQCALSVIAVQCVCRLHADWVVVPFLCGRVFCHRVLFKELRWVPSWNRASMVFTSRRRVAFKSNSVVRGTTSSVVFFLQVFSPRFCGMFFKLLFQCFSCKTFLSCCTTRAMAIGVTERNRRCEHLIVGVGVKSV